MATTQAPASALDSLLASLATAGSNSASSSSGTSLNGQASQAAQMLLDSMQGLTAGNTATSVAAAQSTATDLLRQLMPSVAGSARGAGLYNSTTQKQLFDNTQAQITSAMAKQLQDQINTNQQLQTQAGSAVSSLNSSTRTETSQKGQTTGQALGSQLGALVLGQGLSALKKGFGSSLFDSASDVANTGFSFGDTSLFSNWGDSFLSSSGASSLGSGLTDLSGGFADVGAGLSNWLSGASSLTDSTSALSNTFDMGSSIVDGSGSIIDGIGGAISDAWSGLGSWTGWWANGGRIPGADSTGGHDNKIIGVGGGEVVLPPDTVKALDTKLGENWVQDLIDATHTEVKPKPTAAALAAKKAVTN